MPALARPRQERFCQLVKRGIPPFRAYPMAGYRPNNGAPYRLAENVRVKRRLAELTRHIAMKTRVTIESITQELDRIRVGAEGALQYGAARSAVETKAKLHGLLVERKEQGQPGDFAGLQSAAEVMAVVETELGPETAALLSAALERREEQASAPDAIDTARDEGSTLQ